MRDKYNKHLDWIPNKLSVSYRFLFFISSANFRLTDPLILSCPPFFFCFSSDVLRTFNNRHSSIIEYSTFENAKLEIN